jgi:hypothetical protein
MTVGVVLISARALEPVGNRTARVVKTVIAAKTRRIFIDLLIFVSSKLIRIFSAKDFLGVRCPAPRSQNQVE